MCVIVHAPHTLTCYTLPTLPTLPQVFADLPAHFLLDPDCVDKGQYVDHGTFGDIYHGSVYPTPSSTVSLNHVSVRPKISYQFRMLMKPTLQLYPDGLP